jgi:hypothetical protein
MIAGALPYSFPLNASIMADKFEKVGAFIFRRSSICVLFPFA